MALGHLPVTGAKLRPGLPHAFRGAHCSLAGSGSRPVAVGCLVEKYRASALCTVCWRPKLFLLTRKEEAIVFREVKAGVMFSATFINYIF